MVYEVVSELCKGIEQNFRLAGNSNLIVPACFLADIVAVWRGYLSCLSFYLGNFCDCIAVTTYRMIDDTAALVPLMDRPSRRLLLAWPQTTRLGILNIANRKYLGS